MLKRLLVLAVALTLFVTAFLIYFHVADARIEHDFLTEREKFNVQGLELTTMNPPAHEPVAAVAPPPLPSAAVPVPSASTPGDAPTATPADAPVDSNSLIGPLPPSSSATPDNSTPPATNASPSTLIYPGLRQLPFAILASYTTKGLRVQSPTDTTTVPAVPATAAPPVAPEPAAIGTNAAVPAPAPVTNVSPAAVPAPRAAKTVASSVIVLGFHQFSPPGVRSKNMYNMPQDVFESEMKYLKDNNYHVVPLSDVVRFAKGEISLPPDSVAVTIDDGYKSSINYAAPVLKKYGFPWTFFVYPAFITRTEGKGAASWPDLVELQREGVDIECHSMTHPNLKLHKQKVKGVWHNFTPEEYAAWLNNETAGSKAELEQKMGKPITCFAYPYGEYNTQVEDAAIAAGYEAIFTVADNPVHWTTSLHSIGRYTMTTDVLRNFPAYLRQGALGLDAADPAPGTTTSDPRPVITATLGYAGKLDPKSIETQVRDFGDVRHDFDPETNTLRLYLPRDLIAPVVLVNIRVKDAATGQYMVANWHFNYEPGPNAVHAPIAPATNAPAPAPKSQAPAPAAKTASVSTNAPAATDPEPLDKSAIGTPLDTHRPSPAPPATPTSTHD